MTIVITCFRDAIHVDKFGHRYRAKTTCIIKDSKENVIAMGYVSDNMKISFFTEDETVNDIKPIGVIEEGGEK